MNILLTELKIFEGNGDFIYKLNISFTKLTSDRKDTSCWKTISLKYSANIKEELFF